MSVIILRYDVCAYQTYMKLTEEGVFEPIKCIHIFKISLNRYVGIVAMALSLSVFLSVYRTLSLLTPGLQNVVEIYILLLHIDQVCFRIQPRPLSTLKIVKNGI